MKRQLLMCIRDTLGLFGELFAKKGSTYTLVDSAKCERCGKGAVSVEGVAHPYTSVCIPGPNWLDGANFVPLNDPGAEPERTEVKAPRPAEKQLDEELAEIEFDGGRSW